ncbi:MAG: DUF1801 domain-containing protein [Anaerolineae bacterium]
MHSDATTVDAYLAELTPERRAAMEAVRAVVLANLPPGYVETMRWGMISYEVPLEVYPDTYNGEPLSYGGLASQKNHMSLYLMGIYADEARRERFEQAYRATGKRLDVGKACVRFRKLDDLPLELVAEVVAAVPIEEHVAQAKATLAARKKRN